MKQTEKTNKKHGVFYKIYFAVLGFMLAALAACAVLLSRGIAEYNKGIPETVSKEYFDTHFAYPDDHSLSELCPEVSEFESHETVYAYLRDLFAKDELSYTSISSGADALPGQKDYIVKSGDYKIASFTLLPDEKNDYHPSFAKLTLPSSAALKCKVYDGSVLMLNGKDVPDTYISGSEETRITKLLPEGTPGARLVLYEIPGLVGIPNVEIKDRHGNVTPLTPGEDGIYAEPLTYDEPETDLVDRITEGAKKYAACMQSDAAKYTVYPYFEEGSELYENIRSAENMFVWDHNGYEITDVKVTEFRRYDENTVSCRISFTHILHKYGSADYRDYFDMTYFARKGDDGVYRIYASLNN